MARTGFNIGPARAEHPHLVTADTKFNAGGVYKSGLIMDGAEAQKMVQKIDDLTDEAFEAAKAKLSPEEWKIAERYVPYDIDEDDQGNPTGYVKFNVKQNATIKLKEPDRKTGKMTKDMRPSIVNADLTKFPKGKDIWGGSTLICTVVPRDIMIPPPVQTPAQKKAGEPKGPHTIGIQLALAGVQVIELKSGGGAESKFQKQEGYVPTAEEAAEADAQEAEADAPAKKPTEF